MYFYLYIHISRVLIVLNTQTTRTHSNKTHIHAHPIHALGSSSKNNKHSYILRFHTLIQPAKFYCTHTLVKKECALSTNRMLCAYTARVPIHTATRILSLSLALYTVKYIQSIQYTHHQVYGPSSHHRNAKSNINEIQWQNDCDSQSVRFESMYDSNIKKTIFFQFDLLIKAHR